MAATIFGEANGKLHTIFGEASGKLHTIFGEASGKLQMVAICKIVITKV